MKYTIEGFSQEYASTLKATVQEDGKEKNICIDCVDLVILRWFVDFYPSMKKTTIDGRQYAWVNYQTLLDNLPLLNIKKQMLAFRFKKLVYFKLLTHTTLRDGGTYSYYGFGENYMHLIENKNAGSSIKNISDGNKKINEGVVNKLYTPDELINEGVVNRLTSKDSSIKLNSSIKDSSIKENIKKERKKESYDEIVAGYTEDEELKEVIFEFIKMRKNIKSPLTDYALKMILKKLDTLASDKGTKIKILNQSIINNWRGIFPLKGDDNTNNSKEDKEDGYDPKKYNLGVYL